jgi:hypothetical protein
MVRPERFERPTYWFVASSSEIPQVALLQQLATRSEPAALLIPVETAYICEALAGAISTTRDRCSTLPILPRIEFWRGGQPNT